MRGVPDHSPEQPAVPTSDPIPVCTPTVTPKTPLPEALAVLGREVLELVPRKQRGSLQFYRQTATALEVYDYVLRGQRLEVWLEASRKTKKTSGQIFI